MSCKQPDGAERMALFPSNLLLQIPKLDLRVIFVWNKIVSFENSPAHLITQNLFLAQHQAATGETRPVQQPKLVDLSSSLCLGRPLTLWEAESQGLH